MSALPALDDYSIPEGRNTIVTRDGLDPRFTVDMSNADPVETGLTYMYTDAPVTYPFGYGLSYSKFAYDNLHVDADPATNGYTATVDVKNTGSVDTSEVVQLYAANLTSTYGAAAPTKQLVNFEKVAIPAGATKTVTLKFTADDLALWNVGSGKNSVEAGNYRFMVGASSGDIRLSQDKIVPGETFGPVDARTAPINVFDHSFDSSEVTYREASKQNTANGLRTDRLVNGYYAVMSRAAGAWTAINDVDFGGSTLITLGVASKNASSSVEVRLDSPDGPKVADLSFPSTGAAAYTIPGATAAGNIPVTEMAYRDVTVPLTRPITGTHDVYIVFAGRDIRVKSLQLGGASTSQNGTVGGTVPATLSLTLGNPASFGPFAPGADGTYDASTTANVTSTAGDATLSVTDPSTNATGRLVNGTFALAEPLQAKAGSGAFAPLTTTAGSPLALLTYTGPVSNDAVTIGFRQHIGRTQPLRTGSYSKTLTFTLSTTQP